MRKRKYLPPPQAPRSEGIEDYGITGSEGKVSFWVPTYYGGPTCYGLFVRTKEGKVFYFDLPLCKSSYTLDLSKGKETSFEEVQKSLPPYLGPEFPPLTPVSIR